MNDLATPFNEIRNKIQRAVSIHPMLKDGQILAIDTTFNGLIISADHGDEVRTWNLTIHEVPE